VATSLFVNIPTADIARAKTFYAAIGWTINPNFSDKNAVSVVIDDDKFLMVLARDYYQGFLDGTGKQVGDPATTSLALISFSLDSREAVDDFIGKVIAAGGKVSDPKDYGFMYQRAFEDPDGNRFEPFWMDPAAAEGGPENATSGG
jgi:predicted lactoylglutathione lyase